jgi:hypothetical protein
MLHPKGLSAPVSTSPGSVLSEEVSGREQFQICPRPNPLKKGSRTFAGRASERERLICTASSAERSRKPVMKSNGRSGGPTRFVLPLVTSQVAGWKDPDSSHA